MSLVFSNSVEKSGIVELIDSNCHSNSTSYPIEEKTRDINLALDLFLAIAIKAGGKWQLDDSNHTDYPIITTNLVANQRDYTFTSDERGNLILDVYKVMVKDASGVYREIPCVDQQSEEDMESFYSGLNATGTPTRYDKTANGIFLDTIPSYNSPGGLKVFINREASYFVKADTTKKPGVDGRFHEFFAIEPSIKYCKRNKMFDLADRYQQDSLKMQREIQEAYQARDRDTRKAMIPGKENCR